MTSQRQIEANRANLKKRKGLTEEGRQRLREAALRNRPWERSTGPRTEAGKARSSKNALKHGWDTNERRAVRRAAFDLLEGIMAFRRGIRGGEPGDRLAEREERLIAQAAAVGGALETGSTGPTAP